MLTRRRFSALHGTLIVLLAIVVGLLPRAAAAADCHALTGRSFADATIIETDQVSTPISIGSLGTAPGKGSVAASPFCRVTGVARPSGDSEIRFEVWLPAPSAWNGKLQTIGNGGFAGNIAYGGMSWSVAGGFAVAATDTGHVGASSDSRWGIGHPEKIVDLGWRAIHETTAAAKAVIAAYYGTSPTRSYYSGCSTGGRQGLVAAQRFPADFDGIIVGAPAYDWPRLLAFDATKYQSMSNDPARWLSPTTLALINAASLRACHAVNGLIDDPGACRFDPAVLRCREGRRADCLADSQLAMARLMYFGLRDVRGGTIYPGFTPGLEKTWALWNLGSEGKLGRDSLAYAYPTGFYGNLLHQDPSWTIERFDLATDLPAALAGPLGAAVYAQDANLAPFFARGGKLIHYHGWQDPAIPAAASLRYYQSVAAALGGVDRVRSSYRLFMGTGMLHCGGGPGPNAIGGVSGTPPVRDADHDVVAALDKWVEGGVAPERIVATHYARNDPSQPVDGQRPWCAWPAAPRYLRGDRARAESYACIPRSREPGHG